MGNYYVTIKGKRYDRALYETALEAVRGKGDGRISRADADKLLRRVLDRAPGSADVYTDVEKETVKLLRESFRWTDAADQHFRTTVRKVAALRVWELRQQGGAGAAGQPIAPAELAAQLPDNPIAGVSSGFRMALPQPSAADQAPPLDTVKAALADLNQTLCPGYDPSTIELRFMQRRIDTDSVPDLIVEEGLLRDGPYDNPARRRFADGMARYIERLLAGGGELYYSYYRDQRDGAAANHALFVITHPGQTEATLLQVDVG